MTMWKDSHQKLSSDQGNKSMDVEQVCKFQCCDLV